LRDELLGGYDSSQETYEEWLQRINLGDRPFNMNEGGLIGGGTIAGTDLGSRTGFEDPHYGDKKVKNPTKIFSKETLKMKDAVVEYNQMIIDGVKKKDISGVPDFNTFYKKKTGNEFWYSQYEHHVDTSGFPARKRLPDVRIDLASDLVDEANSVNKHIIKADILRKIGLKSTSYGRDLTGEYKEIFKRLVPTEKKIQNYFDNMFMNFDTAADDVLNPKIKIAKEFRIGRGLVDRSLNKYKNFKDMKPLMTRLSNPAFMHKIKGKNWTLGQVDKAVQSGTFFKTGAQTEYQLFNYAARHVEQGGDLIQFYKGGKRLTTLENLTSWDGVTFKSRPNNEVAFGKKVYGLGGDLKNKNYVDLQLGAIDDPLFEKYFTQKKELNNLRKKPVQFPKGHPKAGKWTTFEQLMKETYNRASGYKYTQFPYELDHFGGVKKNPFGRIQILPRIINQAAGSINFWVPEGERAKYLERIKYKEWNLDDLVKNELKLAEDTLVFDKQGKWIGKKIKPLYTEAKDFFTKGTNSALTELMERTGSNIDPQLVLRAAAEDIRKNSS
jgi:hypothetical protein